MKSEAENDSGGAHIKRDLNMASGALVVWQAPNSLLIWNTFDGGMTGNLNDPDWRQLVRKYNASGGANVSFHFESPTRDKASNEYFYREINIFLEKIRLWKITDHAYNIRIEELRGALDIFLENVAHLGFTQMCPYDNLIYSADEIEWLLDRMRENRSLMDSFLIKKYQNSVNLLRQLHREELVTKRVDSILERIYFSEGHTWMQSIFDSKGRELRRISEESHEWYPVYEKNYLMLAIGTFGFRDPQALRYIALHRIIFNKDQVIGKVDWKSVDYLLVDLLNKGVGLVDFFYHAEKKKFFKSTALMQSIPLHTLMPGQYYLFKRDYDEETKYILKNFYPKIDLMLINS